MLVIWVGCILIETIVDILTGLGSLVVSWGIT
jgi:hypothetical protein